VRLPARPLDPDELERGPRVVEAEDRPDARAQRGREPDEAPAHTQSASSTSGALRRVPRRLPASRISSRSPEATSGSRRPTSSRRAPVRLAFWTVADSPRRIAFASVRSASGTRASRLGRRVSRRSSSIASRRRFRCGPGSKS